MKCAARLYVVMEDTGMAFLTRPGVPLLRFHTRGHACKFDSDMLSVDIKPATDIISKSLARGCALFGIND